MIKIAPSLLAANFANLENEILRLNTSSADLLHLDIMDGCFVPNISFGPAVIKAIRPLTKLVFDVHLMIEHPEDKLEWFSSVGADIITVHAEACDNLSNTIDKVHSLGVKAGVAIKPETNETVLADVLDKLDMILVMTVNPGFGGQSFMDNQLAKISRIRELIGKRAIDLSVDGGINRLTAPMVLKAGANQLVAGTAVFNDGDITENINDLRQF